MAPASPDFDLVLLILVGLAWIAILLDARFPAQRQPHPHATSLILPGGRMAWHTPPVQVSAWCLYCRRERPIDALRDFDCLEFHGHVCRDQRACLQATQEA